MTSLGAGLTTETPTLLIVADLGLGSAELKHVREYVAALEQVQYLAYALVRVQTSKSRRSRLRLEAQMRVIRSEPGLRVARMRLESPLEVVLTAVAQEYSPIAYGVAGIAVVERVVRLVMEWQKHRMELAAMRRLPPPERNDPGPRRIAREVVEPAYKDQPEVSEEEIDDAVTTAEQPIAALSRTQLTRVKAWGIGR